MYYKTLSKSHFGLLGINVFAAACLIGPIVASAAEETLQEVIVTGSRIYRKDLESNTPLTVINKAEIDLESVQTVSDLVKDLPEVAGAMITTHISNGGGDGTSDVTLRGLPATETLVLQNGRRIPVSKFGETPDINAIPVQAIDRVEILKDGASAIYGADATAGVVNIITRKDFDGIELEGYYGQAGAGDFPNHSASILFGKNFDKGNVTLGFNYFHQDQLKSKDRDVSAVTLAPSSAVPWTRFSDLGLTLGCGSTVKNPTLADYRAFDGSSACLNNFTTGGDRFNYNDFTTSIIELKRTGFYGSAHYDVTDNFRLFAEGNFTETASFWELAPNPLFTSQEVPAIGIAPNQTFLPAGIAAQLVDPAIGGLTPDPVTGLLFLDFRRRNLELGTRHVDDQHDKKHFIGGFEGSFNDWDWSTAFNWGRTDSVQTTSGLLSKSHLQLALGDPADCAALAAIGCVQANIFGSALADSLTPAMVSWISTDATVDSTTELRSFTFDVTNSDLQKSFGWELPVAGPIGFAAGFEYREEAVDILPDALLTSFQTIGATNQLPTHGRRDAKEFYGELAVPLHEMLELDASFRYSDFSQFGTTVNPKVSGVFTPAKLIPGLRLRGSWGRGFRAPTLIELFFGGQENFGTFVDPCSPLDAAGNPQSLFLTLPGCNGTPSDPTLIQFLSLAGGNPSLKPEKSETWTMGFAYSPEWMPGLNATLDYYNIDIRNAILSNSQFIIDLAAQGAPGFVNLVQRDAAGNIIKITGGFLNLVGRSTEGLDYSVDYTFPEYDWGQLRLGVQGNFVMQFLDQADPAVAPIDITGVFIESAADGLGSIPRFKFTANANWSRGPLAGNVRVHYIDDLEEDSFLGGPAVNVMNSWTTVDLQASYTLDLLGSNTKITLGVDNVGDKAPPVAQTGFDDNIDGRTYDLIGRFWYTRLNVSF